MTGLRVISPYEFHEALVEAGLAGPLSFTAEDLAETVAVVGPDPGPDDEPWFTAEELAESIDWDEERPA